MVRTSPREFHIYCDESCTHKGSRYMVYGGIVLPARHVDRFNTLFATWRIRNKMGAGELKWEKVTKARLAAYKSFIDFYFSNRGREGFQFKAMTVDTRSEDYRAFRKENREIGYYKLYYFFLLRKLLPYAKDNDYSICVYLDDRSTNYKFTDLRTFLNLAARRDYGLSIDVVRVVARRRSHESQPIQLADVLMGAIGWAMNKMGDRPDASPPKKALESYLTSRLQVASLRDQVYAVRNPSFNIWQFQFSGKKRPET
jgi:hypothetical protein